jgi:hypothetical protein
VLILLHYRQRAFYLWDAEGRGVGYVYQPRHFAVPCGQCHQWINPGYYFMYVRTDTAKAVVSCERCLGLPLTRRRYDLPPRRDRLNRT